MKLAAQISVLFQMSLLVHEREMKYLISITLSDRKNEYTVHILSYNIVNWVKKNCKTTTFEFKHGLGPGIGIIF